MNASTGVARAVVTHLASAGVRDVVVSPGSRSAPLVYALAAADRAGWLRTHVRVDERSAAFFAVGLARAASLGGVPRPVAVVTTSGTAVANLHPAVLEASHAGLPVVVVSADRPHELRGTGANQTTLQPGVFGPALRAVVELPVGFRPDAVRGQVTRVVAAALGTVTRDPGPAQLNVCLAEPLTPDAPWDPGELPDPVRVTPAAEPAPLELPPGRRTVVVAGDGSGPDAARVASAAGWPLLAEPSSGARVQGALARYGPVLATPLAAQVERVVVFGHPTLTRPVSRLLARAGSIVVSRGPRWTDAAGAAGAVVSGVAPPQPTDTDRAWLARWRAADEEQAARTPTPIQRAALAVWHTEGPLLLGSSNTVRAFDAVVPGAGRAVDVVANRGLAGIDGLVSTGAGLAAGAARPVRVVLGDLSFLHDVGGLARGELEPEVDLQVVVLDDHGGGIFATLEHASGDPDTFARYFTTPHVLDVPAAAAALGASCVVTDPRGLPRVLAAPVRGRSVVHVRLAG